MRKITGQPKFVFKKEKMRFGKSELKQPASSLVHCKYIVRILQYRTRISRKPLRYLSPSESMNNLLNVITTRRSTKKQVLLSTKQRACFFFFFTFKIILIFSFYAQLISVLKV